MAESSDVQAAGQHYLVCGTKDCKKNCQFYCNPCHRQLCEHCRSEHLESPNTKDHEIVFYRLRKRPLPVDKCKLHPVQNIDTLCTECAVPLCNTCSTMQEHQGHEIADLKSIYADKCALCQRKIDEIRTYFLPTSQDMKTEIKEDVAKIKDMMESFRKSMQTEADSLKKLVDEVASDNIEQSLEVEKSLLKIYESQDTMNENYITHLEKIIGDLYGCLATTSLKLFFSKISEQVNIPNIPQRTKLVSPVFTAGKYTKDDITNLLGRVYVPDTKSENKGTKETKQIEIASTQENATETFFKQDRKNEMNQSFFVSPSVIMIKEYKLPGIIRVCHLSLNRFGRLWVSDWKGNLVQTDLKGNQLLSIQTHGRCEGYHTVTQDGGLIYADRVKKVIKKITLDNKVTKFIKTRDWEPLSVHSSHINGDILVGMIKGKEAKVTRYDKTGKEMQTIYEDNNGKPLFSYPHYVTENINGDVCASDYNRQAIVVVNKSGQHRFSYKGQKSGFYYWGVCTDVLGHILACESISEEVHLLDQDGGFLSILLTSQHGVVYPRSVCVDDENNLYVGKGNTNTLRVYKYLT